MDIKTRLRAGSKKFNKIVIWGFRTRWHTHRFIFQAYYQNLKKCGVPVIWVEDEKKNQVYIEANDLVFTASGMHGKMVPEKKGLQDYHFPFREDVFYCFHTEPSYILETFNPIHYVYTTPYENKAEQFPQLYEAVHWDASTRTLYQPWGTNLLPEEFKKPTFNRYPWMFWIGSIWKDTHTNTNWGNRDTIVSFKEILDKFGIKFLHARFVPNFLNTFLIRNSRLAPAIAGPGQVESNYLPCRMFKNISYGQLGFSNIKKFNAIFKECQVYDEDLEKMIEKVLSLPRNEYVSLIKQQQEICKTYTIANHLNNIFSQF